MWYICDIDNNTVYTKDKPEQDPYIELERMIPIPNKKGYAPALKADYDTKKVWYDLIETNAHKWENEIIKLKDELANLDYPIIKSYECSILGLPEPYTKEQLADLHLEKQKKRDRINELEELLNHPQTF